MPTRRKPKRSEQRAEIIWEQMNAECDRMLRESRAMQCIYDAWSVEDPRHRVRLARKALKIWPDCSDAYSILATDLARNIDERLALLEKGVAAAERAVRDWGDPRSRLLPVSPLGTRPFLQVSTALALCLWELNRRDEAVVHYEALLALDRKDGQGVRFLLANAYLVLKQDDLLGRLIRRFRGDRSVPWLYTKALWCFRTEGPGVKANRNLRAAIAANEWVPDYLLGIRDLPEELPLVAHFGGEDQAVVLAYGSIAAWKDTPYALDWLRDYA